MDVLADRRVELEREIETCTRLQNRLAEQAHGRVFTPEQSRDWGVLQNRIVAARRQLDAKPTRRL